MRQLLALLLLLAAGGMGWARPEEGAADEKAAAIAAQVMTAMGGSKAYDNTHYLTWRFFGKRLHVWDKWSGDARIEDGKGLVVCMNVNTRKGKAWQDGSEITDAAALEEKMTWGYEVWINDSYWLVMPYKLRDPGVTLSYTREDKTEDGRAADVLTMTFANVGVTPENKYEIFVDRESHLVTQWSFFEKAADSEPRFTTPWADWKRCGEIMLSANRGQRGHSDVAVLTKVPPTTFTSAAPLTNLQSP